MRSSLWVQEEEGGFESVRNNFLNVKDKLTYSNLRKNVAMKFYPLFTGHMSINILLKVLIGYFVSVLELSIIITFLLHCIIRQVNEPITQIFQIEFDARRPNIPIFVEVALVLPEN
jgi:hypothetical protein